ncbi:SusC/RagA family TonB-linked outer membrane protein [Flavitalea flava]
MKVSLLSKPLALTLCILAIFIPAFSLQAQNTIHIKGRILNESGQPVIKATILVKGSKTGVSSDETGNFEIVAPSDATLLVSSVGFTNSSIRVAGRPSIEISLTPSANSLSQVIVVGYGTQKRQDVTGSVVSVSANTLQEVPTANVISELKGRAAGVDIVSNSSSPGASGQIRIRGNRSLSAELPNNNIAGTVSNNDALNAPLMVVDGIPYGGSINDLNPDDIASLDILKDASATAIYGSRGSGGVLLITTRRGKPGKAVMSYSGYYGLSNATGDYKVYNGAGYAALKAEAQAGNSVNPGTTAYGLTTAEQAGLANNTSTDWQKLIYQQGHATNHQLSLAGGNETTRFSLGAGYYRETGIIPGQDFTRYSLRATVDHQINRKLKIGINILNSLSYMDPNSGQNNPTQGLVRLSPLVSPYNADGSVNKLPQTGSIDGATVNPLSIKYNAAAILNRDRRLRTFNSLYGEWEIIKGLKYRVNVGLDYLQDQQGTYSGPNTFYNSSTALSGANESVLNAEAWTYTVENLLTYDKTIREKHRITFTGLYSFQKDHTQSSAFSGNGIPADYIQNYNLGLAGSVNANTTSPGNNSFSERGLISYMARLNYAFDNRFLFTATVRTDGSSVLSPGNQYFTYPALAAGWNIGNEKFMNTIPAVTSLKLRGGWGITSNQGINPYATLGALSTNAYNFGPVTLGQNSGYLVTSLANKSLKWQSTSEYNIGIDFGLFKNRITGAIEVYDQRTSNILLQESLPGSNGAGNTIVNAGKTKGNGFELSISSINVQTPGGFTWSTDLNFSVDRGKIVQLQNPALKKDIANGWFVGQPISVIYDVKKTGIWQTADSASARTFGQRPGQIRVEDISGPNGKPDGKIDANDAQVIGNYQPNWTGGLTNRFAYRNFDLSVVMYARMGQTVAVTYITSDGGAQGFDFFNNGRNNQVKTDYWTPSHATNAFPRPDASADKFLYASTLAYQDGSFIKMRSINLGYTLSPKLLNRAGISSVRMYLTAINPFIIYSPLVRSGLGLDPEGNGYAGGVTTAVTGGSVPTIPLRAITVGLNAPPTRQFNLGVNVKF